MGSIKISKKIIILIAEDDEISHMYFEEQLPEKKIHILRAYNGKEAVDLCKQHPEINMVLMDIKMPVMNGLEAIKQIKKLKSSIPIIAQSAYVTEKDKKNAFEAGCDKYIEKPIKIIELFSLIEKYGSQNG